MIHLCSFARTVFYVFELFLYCARSTFFPILFWAHLAALLAAAIWG